MSYVSVRTALAVTLSILTISVTSADISAGSPRVVVRVYDTGGGTPAIRAAAIRTASAIVAEAGVVVEWRDCTENSFRSSCENLRRTGNIIVRLMPAPVAGSRPGGSAIEARRHRGDAAFRLGLAVVNPGTGLGSMATLFHDRVQTVARRTGVDVGELLGRALAHEIGHLLLGVNGHSASGLMRAVWTDAELATNRAEDWLFAQPDRQRLQFWSIASDDDPHDPLSQ